jgi:primase-polymerase (primpol)-like protein
MASAKFRDLWSPDEEALWISAWDAGSIFGLTTHHLKQLPVVDSQTEKKRYWLYHVWDFFRFHVSEAEADAALKVFLKEKDEAADDIMWEIVVGGGGYRSQWPEYRQPDNVMGAAELLSSMGPRDTRRKQLR